MLLSARKNLRVLLTGGMEIGGAGAWDVKKVTGGGAHTAKRQELGG